MHRDCKGPRLRRTEGLNILRTEGSVPVLRLGGLRTGLDCFNPTFHDSVAKGKAGATPAAAMGGRISSYCI